MIGTLTVNEWVVTFGTVNMGMDSVGILPIPILAV